MKRLLMIFALCAMIFIACDSSSSDGNKEDDYAVDSATIKSNRDSWDGVDSSSLKKAADYANNNKEVGIKSKVYTAVKQLTDEGYIKLNLAEDEVFVKPIVWRQADYQQKEEMAKIFVLYNEYEKNKDNLPLTVRDMNSGKELASNSVYGGLKIAEE